MVGAACGFGAASGFGAACGFGAGVGCGFGAGVAGRFGAGVAGGFGAGVARGFGAGVAEAGFLGVLLGARRTGEAGTPAPGEPVADRGTRVRVAGVAAALVRACAWRLRAVSGAMRAGIVKRICRVRAPAADDRRAGEAAALSVRPCVFRRPAALATASKAIPHRASSIAATSRGRRERSVTPDSHRVECCQGASTRHGVPARRGCGQ
jgi:hypothetical protein